MPLFCGTGLLHCLSEQRHRSLLLRESGKLHSVQLDHTDQPPETEAATIINDVSYNIKVPKPTQLVHNTPAYLYRNESWVHFSAFTVNYNIMSKLGAYINKVRK